MSDTEPDETTTRALVVHAIDDLQVQRIPLPAPAGDEAMVRILYGGICGSDLHYWQHGAAGQSILREPMVLGHEVVGVVERAASDGSGPAVGVRVAVHPARYEYTPVRFPAERPNLSPATRYLGSAARLPHMDGAFADKVVLPASMLRALPESIPADVAALIEPASVAWHAVSRAGDISGKRVLVIGAGPIGALIVAVAKARGAGEIVAVDLHPRPLETARGVGADRTIIATDQDSVEAVDADVSFDSSGSPRGLASAIRATTRGGRVVMVGLLPDGDQPLPIAVAISRELDLVGSFRFHNEIDDVITALADGSLSIAPVITHRYPVKDALTAMATAADATSSGKVLLDFS